MLADLHRLLNNPVSMTPAIYETVEHYIRSYGLKLPRVLEVGSQDVNGSVRELFTQEAHTSEYIGIDFQEAKGVDIVATPTQLLELSEDWARSFDAVVCLEVLEHDIRFWETLTAIKKLMKPGAYFFLSVPTYGFGYHGYPKDYYRFSHDSFKEVLLDGFTIFDMTRVKDTIGQPGLIGLGRLPYEI